ncbi:hypothetical protein IX38_19705 [Chryseobacterium luteum]|uniref:Uncharacterized protein n=1 Tax=Chryseobacterium luteum TaxID=421531 RepID=A0A085Z0C9_9FLAO|nr:hypothetical protein IX38_19705 [Chryseobacterium luteum]
MHNRIFYKYAKYYSKKTVVGPVPDKKMHEPNLSLHLFLMIKENIFPADFADDGDFFIAENKSAQSPRSARF